MTPEELKRQENLLKIIDGFWRRSIYDQSWIGALLEKVVEIEADRRGIEDNGMVIWTMLTTELWFRTFIDPKQI